MPPTTPPDLPGKPAVPVFTMPDRLDREWVTQHPIHPPAANAGLVLDFATTTIIDAAGISFVNVCRAEYAAVGGRLVIRNIQRALLAAITAAGSAPAKAGTTIDREPFFSQIGSMVLGAKNTALGALSVFVEMFYWGTIGFIHKKDIRKGSLGEQMYQLGFKAVGIVGLLSFLIGAVLALQSAIQLRNFGAGIFLAPMIGISMIRELGPLLTAIILAGRTGSATTAEIATMVVGEEIDALKTMGINPIQFVVVPKFWAITLTMPVLNTIATLTGILGGWIVAVLYLDLSSSLFWGELTKNIYIKDVMAGLLKTIIFSWEIVWVGTFHGLRVRGGAESVGRETTASVVTGIFIIIITDAIMSFVI